MTLEAQYHCPSYYSAIGWGMTRQAWAVLWMQGSVPSGAEDPPKSQMYFEFLRKGSYQPRAITPDDANVHNRFA